MSNRLPRDVGYLAALGTALVSPPSEDAARRHVTSASRTARESRTHRISQRTRLGLLSLALATLVSTSGVAMAGSLPHPVQNMLADAARLLPVPLPVPYPAAPTTIPPSDPSLSELRADTEEAPAATAKDDAAPRTLPDAEPADERGTERDHIGEDHRDHADRAHGDDDTDRRGGDERDRTAWHDQDGHDLDDRDTEDGDRHDRDLSEKRDRRDRHDDSDRSDRQKDSGEHDRDQRRGNQGGDRDESHRDSARDRDRD